MGKVTGFIQNMSLRKTIVFYITLFALIAIGLSALTSFTCNVVKDRIYSSYPSTGERYYLTNEAGERLGQGVGISTYGSPDLISKRDSHRLKLLEIIPMAAIPLYSALSVLAAAILFYSRKLKAPLALLSEASRKISQNDLDFSLHCENQDELGRLCGSFEIMRAALAQNYSDLFRQMEERKRLNTAFAHDLRTPLTVLKGYAEILLEHEDPKVTETAAVMSRHLLRLERYADSMSSIRRLEDRKAACCLNSLADFTMSLRSSAVFLCSSHNMKLTFESKTESDRLSFDPEMISQIYENLLSNAARFAQNRISVLIIEADGGLYINVADDGPGFSHNSLKCADSPFYTETPDGNHFGLGLYICKILLRHHGGFLRLGNTGTGALVTAFCKTADQ